MTHICVTELTSIASDNGLSPGRRQAIIWTNAGILLIGPIGTNVNEILIAIHTFSFKKMHLKMSSAKWRPFCLGLNVLTMMQNDEFRVAWHPSVYWSSSVLLFTGSPMDSPHKGPIMQKVFPCYNIIMAYCIPVALNHGAKQWILSGLASQCRDQSRYVPNQWETSLHCNHVSHWLSAYLDWSLPVFTGPHWHHCSLTAPQSHHVSCQWIFGVGCDWWIWLAKCHSAGK